MDRAEIARLLGVAQQLDGYGQSWEISAETVEAWHLALADAPFAPAQRAVVDHYRTETRRLMIADIVRRTREMAEAQREAEAARRRDEKLRAALAAPEPEDHVLRDPAKIEEILARHRNWSRTGDLGTRRKQARWNPQLAASYEDALRQIANRATGSGADPERSPEVAPEGGAEHSESSSGEVE